MYSRLWVAAHFALALLTPGPVAARGAKANEATAQPALTLDRCKEDEVEGWRGVEPICGFELQRRAEKELQRIRYALLVARAQAVFDEERALDRAFRALTDSLLGDGPLDPQRADREVKEPNWEASQAGSANQAQESSRQSRRPRRFELPLGEAGVPARGELDAPAAMVVFGDLECPFTAELLGEISKLELDFPAQLRIEFRHFPLAVPGEIPFEEAIAAICAEREGRGWLAIQYLSRRSVEVAEETEAIVQQLGLDAGAFRECVGESNVRRQVERDQEVGASAGVIGTPFVFVNGRLVRGRSLEAISAVLIRELRSDLED